MDRKLWNEDAEDKLTTILETEECLDVAEVAIRMSYPHNSIVKHMRRIAKSLNIRVKGKDGVFSIDRSMARIVPRTKVEYHRFVCKCIGPGGDTMSLTVESTDELTARLEVIAEYPGVTVLDVVTKKEHLDKHKIKTVSSIRRRVTNEKYIY